MSRKIAGWSADAGRSLVNHSTDSTDGLVLLNPLDSVQVALLPLCRTVGVSLTHGKLATKSLAVVLFTH